MKTVIVPVDFSETSLNAANYAAQLLAGRYGVTLTLYNSYNNSSDAEESLNNLQSLQWVMSSKYSVKIEVLSSEEREFVPGLAKTAGQLSTDLIVMGITGRSALAQVLFGSNTLKMAEANVCPVLIIPEKAEFSPLKNVMLASDFNNTSKSTPSGHIKKFLDAFNPNLFIVNVNENYYISLTEENEKEKQELTDLFAEFNPEFYFMRLFDVEEAINLFAESRKIDIIIAIQKNHSFINKLLKGSNTKTMSYHSKMPILVMHE